MDPSAAVAAFVSGAIHKYTVETGASSFEADGVDVLAHASEIDHPWPRTFGFRHELFVPPGGAADSLIAARNELGSPPPDHVVNLFNEDEKERDAVAEQLGYLVAWRNVVLGNSDLAGGTKSAAERFDVRSVESHEDIVACNAIQPNLPLTAAALSDPHLIDLIAVDGDAVVGKAQLVTGLGRLDYVSDMFTAEKHRRRGVGAAMMRALHVAAHTGGAAGVALVPSRMAREIGFYDRFGYRPATHFDVLIPA